MFHLQKKVIPDGLYMLSAMSAVLKESFIGQLEELHKYTDNAIKSISEPELLKAGFDTIGHLCRTFPEYQQMLEATFPYLLECLKDPNFCKEHKPTIFLTIGDIALGNPRLIIKFIKNILELYEMGYQAILQLSESKINDNIEYAEILKESIVDSLVCVIHGAIYSDEAQQDIQTIMN